MPSANRGFRAPILLLNKMAQRFLLDTNIASHVIRGDIPQVREKLVSIPMEHVLISAITEAELRYGVARRGHPKLLSQAVGLFLERVEILDWSSAVAKVYGALRARCEASGINLSGIDMMIAAHAKAIDATLVSRDKAFQQQGLQIDVQDWSAPSAS